MDNYGEEIQQPTLKKLLEAQANDRACTQTGLTVVLSKSM